MRTLWTWEHEDPNAAAPLLGRPRHRARAMRDALLAVRLVMLEHGKSIGEPTLHALLGEHVPLTLSRRALARWKAFDRRRAAHAAKERRVSIEPLAPGVFGSLDAGQIGLVDGAPVKALQLVDVCSTATGVSSVGGVPCGNDVVALLEAARVAPRGVPLGVFLDRGSENHNAAVRQWAEQHHVVLIFNVPRTPQHNPWVERKWRDVREVTRLRPSTPLASTSEAEAWLVAGLDQLDERRPRAKHGGATAAQRDRAPRVRYTPASREALWHEVEERRRVARVRCVRARDRPKAEREAAIAVFASRGLTLWTRGGVPIRNAIPEVIS